MLLLFRRRDFRAAPVLNRVSGGLVCADRRVCAPFVEKIVRSGRSRTGARAGNWDFSSYCGGRGWAMGYTAIWGGAVGTI